MFDLDKKRGSQFDEITEKKTTNNLECLLNSSPSTYANYKEIHGNNQKRVY